MYWFKNRSIEEVALLSANLLHAITLPGKELLKYHSIRRATGY
jgi:hypothetical protein